MIEPTQGVLYIVATPIGNLGDMTSRAVEVLSRCDLIAAEDTRHSAHLLQHFAINRPTISFHDFSSTRQLERLLLQLRQGQNIALISDAGTPTIADPGYELVSAARRQGSAVIPIPGASALLAALSVAGLPTDQFIFLGFLPARAAARGQLLERLQQETRTLVFFESPHRITDSLQQIVTVFGAQRLLFVGRELTKKFETTFLAPAGEGLQRIVDDAQQQKGEFVLVLAGADSQQPEDRRLQEALRVLDLLLAELPLKQAVSLAAQISGAPRNELYSAALKKQPEN